MREHFLILESQVINAEERTELVNRYFVAIMVITDADKHHLWMPAPFGERSLGDRIFTVKSHK